MLPSVTRFKRAALDFLFPPYCIGCGREGSFICGTCRDQLSFITPPICPRCGRPLLDNATCPGCIGEETEIDGIRSPFLFSGFIRQAIHALKYNNLRAIAPLLAEYLNDYLEETPLPGEVLVPVPIHRKRQRERGYNQSALIAQELGRLRRLPVNETCLVRRAYTPPQARTANVTDRKENVKTAFGCVNRQVAGKQVIIIDDVSTTGATLDACAGVLKAAGAIKVWGLVLALEL